MDDTIRINGVNFVDSLDDLIAKKSGCQAANRSIKN